MTRDILESKSKFKKRILKEMVISEERKPKEKKENIIIKRPRLIFKKIPFEIIERRKKEKRDLKNDKIIENVLRKFKRI